MAYLIDFEPIGLHILCAEGYTIANAARDAGVSLISVCGGRNTCGHCRVRVLSGRTSPLSDSEKAHLSKEEIAAGFRLACTTRVFSDLKLHITPASLTKDQHVHLLGDEPDLVPNPVVQAYELQLPEPSLQTPLADWENLQKGLKTSHRLNVSQPGLSLMQGLSPVLRAARWNVTAAVRDNEVISVYPQGRELLGIAFDLGTSTIAAYLVNLGTGQTLMAQGAMNPQMAYGEDVMSRISYAIEHSSIKMRESLIRTLNQLLQDMPCNAEEVVEVTMVGNTAMHHLALDLPVKQLGRAPYLPAVTRSLDVKAYDLGLNIAREAYVHFPSNIAGFVGSDHVAMLLAIGICETDKSVLGIDIGTNTEVTLAAKGSITSVSCASGPAFECAAIKHGMRAISGSIEKVKIEQNGINLKVINGGPPTCICGSGILDAISELRSQQIIDRRGRLQNHPQVRQGSDGCEFVLALGETTGTGQEIVIAQNDIEQIQLAKAAVRAGINVLLGEAGIKEDEIDNVMIAGSFGNSIDINSAVGIGLFPPLPLDRFKQIGNAAGVGAKLLLVSKRNRLIAAEITRQVRYIELTVHPQFTHEFARSLPFPLNHNDFDWRT